MGIRARKPARGAKRTSAAGETVEVEAGDFLVSLDEETNYLFKTKARTFIKISALQRSAVTQHYADAQAAVRARPIVVPCACRRVDENGNGNNDNDNNGTNNNGTNRRRRKR